MKEELLIPKSELTFKDLVVGDYFRFTTNNRLVESNKVFRIIENSFEDKKILVNKSYYNIQESYLDSEVIKLKPTKFENDTLYFEEI